jgi:hypothetical protein
LGLSKPKIWQILRHLCFHPALFLSAFGRSQPGSNQISEFELFIVCFAMIKLLQWLSSHEIACRVICVTELRPGSLSFLFHFSCLFKVLWVLQLVAWYLFSNWFVYSMAFVCCVLLCFVGPNSLFILLCLFVRFRFHSGALSPCFDHLLDLFLICFFQF